MKTFSESMHITRHMRQVQECLILMSQNGISPVKFVDWYLSDGLVHQSNRKLNESAQKWLQHNLILAEQEGVWSDVKKGAAYGAAAGGLTGAGLVPGAIAGGLAGAAHGLYKQYAGQGGQPGQAKPQPTPVDKATEELQYALSTLSSRLQQSKTIGEKIADPNFGQTIMQMINSLKVYGSHEKPAGAPTAPAGAPTAPAGAPTAPAGAPTAPAGAPTASAGAPTAPAGAPTAEHTRRKNPYLSETVSTKQKLKNEIRITLRKLASQGIAPETVYESFIAGEPVNEGLWDYARQFGSGVSSWLDQGGWSGFKQGWKDKGTEISHEQDKKAIEDVLAKIDALEKTQQQAGAKPHADFLKFAQAVKQVLTGAEQKAAAEAPGEEAPGGEAPGGEAPGEEAPGGEPSAEDLQELWAKAQKGDITAIKDQEAAKKFVEPLKANVWNNLSPQQQEDFKRLVMGQPIAAPAETPKPAESAPAGTDPQVKELADMAKSGNYGDDFKKLGNEIIGKGNALQLLGVVDSNALAQLGLTARFDTPEGTPYQKSVKDLANMLNDPSYVKALQDPSSSEKADAKRRVADIDSKVPGFSKEKDKWLGANAKLLEHIFREVAEERAFMESVYGPYRAKTSWIFHG